MARKIEKSVAKQERKQALKQFRRILKIADNGANHEQIAQVVYDLPDWLKAVPDATVVELVMHLTIAIRQATLPNEDTDDDLEGLIP